MKALRMSVLAGFFLIAQIAYCVPAIVNAEFGNVSITCGLGYAYQTITIGANCTNVPPQQDFNSNPAFGWTIVPGGAGLTAPNSPFNPPDFTALPFSQAVFLQGAGSAVSQSIGGFSANVEYRLSFYAGSRYIQNGISDGNQTVRATVDGTVIGSWSLVSFTPFTVETAVFSVPNGGSHVLSLDGMTPGDHTAFVSGVSITQVVPEPGTLLMLGTTALLFVRKVIADSRQFQGH